MTIADDIRTHVDNITAGKIGLALIEHADALAAMTADEIRAMAAPLVKSAQRESQTRRG